MYPVLAYEMYEVVPCHVLCSNEVDALHSHTKLTIEDNNQCTPWWIQFHRSGQIIHMQFKKRKNTVQSEGALQEIHLGGYCSAAIGRAGQLMHMQFKTVQSQ